LDNNNAIIRNNNAENETIYCKIEYKQNPLLRMKAQGELKGNSRGKLNETKVDHRG
jgi:hypothetical protein